MSSFLSSLGLRRCGLVLFALIIIPFFTLRPPLIQVTIGIGFFFSWWMGRSNKDLGRIVLSVLTFSAAGLTYYQFSTLQGLEAAVSLLALIAIVQSFDLRTVKDFTLFILICQLLLLSQLLDEYSLWFAFYIVSVSLYLFFIMARFHKIEASRAAQGSLERRKLIRRIFIYSIPLTVALFFLFPRLPLGNIFSFKKKPAGVTGFTSELRPGEIAKIAQDDSTYFRVKMPEDKIAFPLLYWRGGVLSLNDGFAWDKGKTLLRSDVTSQKESKFEYTVTMSTLESSPLFHLKGTKRFKKLSPGHKAQEAGGVQYFHPYANHKTKYTAEFSGVKKEFLFEKDRENYLQIKDSVSQRVRELALSLKRESPDRTYKSVSEFFRTGRFTYTLQPGLQNLESFIFENKKGFCEHYASVAALFLRLNDVPTRVVTGFHGGLYNPSGGYFQVRGQDAHAWLEYWNGEVWKRADPTEVVAPERINFGSEGFLFRSELPEGMQLKDFMGIKKSSMFVRALFAWDSFYNNLNQSFLDYDYKAQKDLFNLHKLRRYSRLVLFIVCLVLLFGLTLLWRRNLKGGGSALDKAYTQFLKKLSKVGIERGQTEGALSLERRLPTDWESYGETVEILEIYREIKYADKHQKLNHFLTKTRLFRPAKMANKGL